jgi:hypothetical protein
MLEEGFEYGDTGIRAFTETYGCSKRFEPADNACSEARMTKRVRHWPGASPLLFGRFLMSLGAFVSLEDISGARPPYRQEVVSVEMDGPLKEAYGDLEQAIKEALSEHRGNQSVMRVVLNALLAYRDRPFGLGNLIGRKFNLRDSASGAVPHRGHAGPGRELCVCQGKEAGGGGQSFAGPR